MPYYYASHCLALMSFEENEGEQRDQVLDRAQELLDQAMALEPGKPANRNYMSFRPSSIRPESWSIPWDGEEFISRRCLLHWRQPKRLNPDNPQNLFPGGDLQAEYPCLPWVEEPKQPDPSWRKPLPYNSFSANRIRFGPHGEKRPPARNWKSCLIKI